MAKQYVGELTEGDTVASSFVATRKDLREFRGKAGKFLSLALTDRTGSVPAVMWDNAEEAAATFEEGGLVFVEGQVGIYQGRPQVRVQRLEAQKPEQVDLADFVARSARDPQEMLKELDAAAETVGNPFLKELLTGFLNDPEVRGKLPDAPAAKGLHHAYLGGLLEHISGCLKIAEAVCATHAELNRDLVVTGVLLHDSGKLEELTSGSTIDYTVPGRLLGHIALGFLRINQRTNAIEDFPDELRMQLSHIILAHHNTPEFGSPVPPMTAEAAAVHFIENCDAQVTRFLGQIRQARASGGQFTEYDKLLERYLYAGPLPEAE